MPTLSQKETALRSTITGSLYVLQTVNPTADDDRNLRYIVGSRWVNTSTDDEFVCVSNEPTAAVWKSTTTGGGGSSIHTDTVAPTVNDDVGDGYVVGTIWVRTTNDKVYLCADNTSAAAVWVEVNATVGNIPHADIVDPTVNDDIGDGYAIGQVWVNTVSDAVFVCTDTTITAAVWVDVSGGGAGTAASITAVPAANNSGTNVQAQLDNINGAIANVFFWGRVTAIVYGLLNPIPTYNAYQYINSYNTVADVLTMQSGPLLQYPMPDYNTFVYDPANSVVAGYNETAF